MNSITRDSDIAAAEAVLAAAGLNATPVAACDEDGCRWCEPASLPVAA